MNLPFAGAIVLLLCGLPINAQQATKRGSIASAPLSFEPSRNAMGSLPTFIARARDYRLTLRPGGFDLDMNAGVKQAASLGIDFVGADEKSAITPSDRQSSESNYFLGRDKSQWRTHVPNFGRVTYSNLYPGIDAVFHGDGQRVEHDFIVHPGADYHLIRLQISGSTRVSLGSRGDLAIQSSAGNLIFHSPEVYQIERGTKKNLRARFFLLADNQVAFAVNDYDRLAPMVIDPVLDYATYVVDSYYQPFAIATDANSSSYVVGCATDPKTQISQLVVTKFNSSGTSLVYSSFFGTSCNPYGGIQIDNHGNAIVAGAFYLLTDSLPLKNPIVQPSPAATWSSYVFSLSADGSSLNYASLLPTIVNAVAIDFQGNAYLAGDINPTQLPATQGGLNNSNLPNGSADVFVAKLFPDGTLSYNALVGDVTPQNGGGGLVGPTAIVADSDGKAYITGAAGTLWPVTSAAYQTQIPGTAPYAAPFVACISADGSSLMYSTFLGTQGMTSVGIAVNTKGEALVTGTGNGIPATNNGYQQSPFANQSYFAILNSMGSQLVYASFLYGGQGSIPLGNTQTTAVALDSSGNIWLAGMTNDPKFPLVQPLSSTLGITQNYQAGFLSEFDSTGTQLLFSTYLGDITVGARYASLAVDPKGKAYVAPFTDYYLFTSPGAYLRSESAPPSGSDYIYGFVEQIDPKQAAPAICIPYPHNFGLPSPTVPLTNCGSLPLQISTIGSADPGVSVPDDANTCLQQVAVNSSCSFTVNYRGTPTINQMSVPANVILTINSNISLPQFLSFPGFAVYVPDFVFTVSPPSLSSVTIPAPGASSPPVTLKIDDQPGYSATVSFTPSSCAITPTGSLSTCSFSPTSIVGSGTTQVTINTTGVSSGAAVTGHRPAAAYGPLSVLVFVIFTFCASFGVRNQFGRRVILATGVIATLAFCSSCGSHGGSTSGSAGGNSSSGGTPPGTYTVIVTASGTNAHTVSFQFKVQ